MATLGFLMVIVLGIYLIFAGIIMYVMERAFTGGISVVGLGFVVMSLVMLYVSWTFKPFSIVML
jgi:hypothetical protein